METLFAIVSIYQYHENYGCHSWDGKGDCPQYWKAKGDHENIVLEGWTASQMAKLSQKEILDLVHAAAPANNDLCRYSFLDYEIVEISSQAMAEIHAAVEATPWVRDELKDSCNSYLAIPYAKGIEGCTLYAAKAYMAAYH